MNLFVMVLRRIAFGGMVILILSLVLRGGLPENHTISIFLIVSPLLYLLFSFFSWMSAKKMTEEFSVMLDEDIPSNNYLVTVIRGLVIDLVSPIGVIVNLFSGKGSGVAGLVFTYAIIVAYVCLWVFVL